MAKLQDWDVYCVNPYLATMIHHVKSIISDGWEEKENLHQSSDSALNITEEILVFTDLGEKDLKLAMELTSKSSLK